MDDAEAARWSEADAAGKHAAISAVCAHDVFSRDRIARCDGSLQVWELGVRLAETNARYSFLVIGSRAGELRMGSAGKDPTESRAPLDLRRNWNAPGAELPW